MKRILGIFALVAALLVGGTVAVQARELTKQEVKEIEKDVKKRCKQLEKAGWEPLASTTTLNYAMMKYRKYLAEDEDNRIALVGIASGRNPKIGRENAIHAGIASYASRAKAQVVGRAKSVLSNDSHNASEEEIDKFGAAYEAGVNAKMGALVKEHFTIVRTNKDGSKEFNVFMSLDESAARQVREEARRDAEERTQLEVISDMTKEFIGEPVAAEE